MDTKANPTKQKQQTKKKHNKPESGLVHKLSNINIYNNKVVINSYNLKHQ